MTVHNDDILFFLCDRCAATEEDENDEGFGGLWAQLKDDGWRAFKDDEGEWQHSCPECTQKWARNQNRSYNARRWT